MRITRNLFLGLFSCLAALLLGVAAAGATHGNATWDCVNNTPVLNVTVLGSTVWEGFDTATYKIQDSVKDSKTVTRGADGIMPNVELRINDGDVILGTYGPGGPRNSNVPYLVTGEKPSCVTEQTTTTTAPNESTTTTSPKTPEETTTTNGNTPTPSTSPATSETLPATGTSTPKVVLAGFVVAALGLLAVSVVALIRKTNPKRST